MDELRLKRYRDKINYIFDSLKNITNQPKNELEKNGIFYCALTAIESMIDLVAMVNKDLGIPVRDDKTNILQIIQERKLNQELGDKLIKANGLRNILVHRYNKVDDRIILESLPEIKTLLFEWLDIIEKIINENK